MKKYVACLVLPLSLLLSAGSSRADSLSKESTTIRYADLGTNTANLYQYLAVEKGIFQKHGIDLKLVSFLKGGPEVIAAAASGQVDLGGIGTPILTGISRGMPIKIVGSPPLRGQEFVLVGRSDITTLADLKGKTVGVSSVGGGQSQALKFILRANGIQEGDVKTIAYGSPSNGYIAMRSGQLAGALLSEPLVSKTELDGVGKVLAKAVDYYGHYQHSYIFATTKFIKDNPEAIRRFFQANREAIQYAQQHRDELIAVGRKKLNLDEALLSTVFEKTIPQWDDSQAIDVEGMLNAINIVKEVGDINKSYSPAVDDIADLRFLK
jgi:NitT/TauT family transport system substrate-binding protein